MNVSTRWLTRAAAGAALLLGACADQTNSPVAPEAPVPTLRTVAIASTGVEQIYLSDTREGGGEDGSVLYGVELDDVAGVANLTALVDLNVRPYNGLFDRAHIAATPDGSLVYLINRDPVPSAGGNPVATYEPASGAFTLLGAIPGMVTCPGKGVVLAAFSPDGDLYVANECNSVVYRIALPSLTVAQQWTVFQAGTSTLLDLTGGDIGFDAEGTLYAWSNAVTTRGLHRIELQAVDAEAVALARQPSNRFVTGLAVRGAGEGNLLGSSRLEDAIVAFDRTTGATVGTFPMLLDGSPFDHTFGDMTVGLLRLPPPPQPGLTISKTAGASAVAAGDPISFTITVTSTGPADATGVSLSDPLPGGAGIDWSITAPVAGCSIAGTSPEVLSCDFGTLAAGASRTVTVRSETTAAACGSYSNTATASADGLAPITASAAIEVACPPPPTGVCEGGVSKLVVKYIGSSPLTDVVEGQRRNPQRSGILPAQTSGVGPNTLYTFAIQSLGGLFTPAANGRLANELTIFVGGTEVATVHTSCSQPIYPGMIIAGLFEIVEVHSVKGGQIGAP